MIGAVAHSISDNLQTSKGYDDRPFFRLHYPTHRAINHRCCGYRRAERLRSEGTPPSWFLRVRLVFFVSFGVRLVWYVCFFAGICFGFFG